MTELLIPRDYQVEGAQFLYTAKRAILADEMRVGKTLQALMAWKMTGMAGPALIIAKPNAQSTWLTQCPMAGVQTPLIISGTQKQRAKEWKEVDHLSLVMVTIESLRNDLKENLTPKRWKVVIFDEAHRAINRKTRNYKTLKELDTEYLFLLTGSPMRRGFQDLWALLNICNHKQFSSYWRYLSTFGYMIRNEWGAYEVLGLKERDALQKVIKPYFLRRTRNDIKPELPPKQRILDHKLQLTKHQNKLYTELCDEMVAELSDSSLLIASTVLAKITRLRQLLCTPKILDKESDWGAGLEHLGELLDDTEDHHFVVYTPFTAAIPHISDYLSKHTERAIYTLQGGLRAEEVSARIQEWRGMEGVMICSLTYAEGFDLFPASWAYFLGFSWDAAVENMQAEDRLQSMQAENPVAYYYPTHTGCIDEELVLEALNLKSTEILKVYRSSPSALKRLLRGE